MAMEDPRKRAAEERKIRIDHSDVYMENDKLTEALETNLDTISRRRYRQVINRDHEIRQLRQNLSSMNVGKTVSAVTSLRPFTTPGCRRLKPPPVIVKLKVRVPSKDDNTKNSDDDDDDYSSDEAVTWNKGRQRRRRKSKVAWGPENTKVASREGSAKSEIKKITKEQFLLNQLDMSAIPPSWYTEVHHPSDITLRRRASSAHPSTRPHPTTTTTNTTRRKSDGSQLRPRRVKSAIPITSATLPENDANESTLFCGGQQQQQHLQQKTDPMRSRRQLMELSGVGKQVESSEVGSNRHKFLEAVRLERERLDVRVKMFLQSCSQVGEGGVSSRKARHYQNIIMPHTLYG